MSDKFFHSVIFSIVLIVLLVSAVMFFRPSGVPSAGEAVRLAPAVKKVAVGDVLMVLNQCEAFEMGSAEPQQHFGKPEASGNEMCDWKGRQIGKRLICIEAGRVYADPNFVQTGYGVWSCGRRDVVSQWNNGWALCCPTQ